MSDNNDNTTTLQPDGNLLGRTGGQNTGAGIHPDAVPQYGEVAGGLGEGVNDEPSSRVVNTDPGDTDQVFD